MKRSPSLTQGFTRTPNPKLERFIRVNPTAVELIRKKPSLGPQNGKWLKRASFIDERPLKTWRAAGLSYPYILHVCVRDSGHSLALKHRVKGALCA